MHRIQRKSFDEFLTLEEKFDYTKSLFPLGMHNEALTYFRMLKEQYEQLNNYERVIECLSCILQSLAAMGKSDEMMHYLPEYKYYCESYGDPILKAKMYTYLGFAHSNNESYDDAISNYEKAVEYSKMYNITKTYLTGTINLIGIYSLKKEYDKSLQLAESIQTYYEQHPTTFTPNTYAAFLLNYMTILVNTKNNQKAAEMMQLFEKEYDNSLLERQYTYFEYIKGKYMLQLKQYEQAERWLLKAYEHISKTKELPTYHLVLEQLVALFEQTNRFERALQFSKKQLTSVLEERHAQRFKMVQRLTKEFGVHQLKELAYRDALTGVHNRRYLDKKGTELIRQALLEGQEVFCAVFDIDSFKVINDEYGHIIGDETIRQLAQNVQTVICEDAIFTRYGGDEFVLLYKNIKQPEAFFKQLFDNYCIQNYEYLFLL